MCVNLHRFSPQMIMAMACTTNTDNSIQGLDNLD